MLAVRVSRPTFSGKHLSARQDLRQMQRSPDGQSAALAGQTDALPAWDLTDLYPSMRGPEIERDFAAADQAAQAFKARYAGKLGAISGAELAGALEEYQRIEEIQGRLMSYAQLQFSSDSTNPAIGQFYQSVNERVTAISANLLFFT